MRAFWKDWLAKVEHVLSPAERAFFLELENDRSRERFMTALWEQRGRAALERWHRNAEDAEQLRSQSPARARTVLVAGKPARIDSYTGCDDRLRPLEVWWWESWHVERQGGLAPATDLAVIQVQGSSFDPRSFAPWEPGDVAALTFDVRAPTSLESLLQRPDFASCFHGREGARLRSALRRALSFEQLLALVPWPIGDEDWLETLRRQLAGAAPPRPPARLELSFPGAFSRQTIVRGQLLIAPQQLDRLAPGQLFDRVTITGDLFSGPRLSDSFEIVHHVAGSAPSDERVELDFYRRLRPGRYLLRLRVADGRGLALLREERELEVPRLAEDAPAPAGYAAGYSRLTRSEVVLLSTFPSVEILPLSTKAAMRVKVTAITTGGPIAAVSFYRDGSELAVDGTPPYVTDVVLDRERSLIEAIAVDPSGRPLARDQRWVERDPPPFAVRFAPLEPGATDAPITLSLPEDSQGVSVECYHGRRLLRGSSGPPHSCPIPPRSSAGVDYLRVVATLPSGESVEDVLFLGPDAPEEIEVRLVELYVSVLDRSGRPFAGLGPADFVIRDGGSTHRPLRVESLANLPLNVALLMDVSSSMGRRVRLAAESAQGFFEDILTPDDRASLLAFNHDLHLRVPFTGDADELRHGAAGLRAWGSTRLYDALVYALFQFTGTENRRALIVLSDGADVGSDFPFEQVLDAAVRAAVAVYPVALGNLGEETSVQLRRLAATTGGSFHTVASIAELEATYRRIAEELRSQYLLVYRPQSAEQGVVFRPVEVDVLREGLSPRNIHGYYP